jgi:hypothetical protein
MPNDSNTGPKLPDPGVGGGTGQTNKTIEPDRSNNSYPQPGGGLLTPAEKARIGEFTGYIRKNRNPQANE